MLGVFVLDTATLMPMHFVLHVEEGAQTEIQAAPILQAVAEVDRAEIPEQARMRGHQRRIELDAGKRRIGRRLLDPRIETGVEHQGYSQSHSS